MGLRCFCSPTSKSVCCMKMLLGWLTIFVALHFPGQSVFALHSWCDGLPPNATQRLEFYGKIDFNHSIRTSQNEIVQRLFNLGMVLAAGYNQPEARRALRQALSSDNLCAMCYWGLAYARGPFMNKYALKDDKSSLFYTSKDAAIARWAIGYAAALVGLTYHKDVDSKMAALATQLQAIVVSSEKANEGTEPLRMMRHLPRCGSQTGQRRVASAENQTEVAASPPPTPSPSPLPTTPPSNKMALSKEQYYIAAMFDRLSVNSTWGPLWEAAEKRYAKDMMEVAKCFPDDADALALAAEALTNLTPWNFVLKGTSAEPEVTPRNLTRVIISTLDESLKRNPYQPLALHLMIHVTEELPGRLAASPTGDATTEPDYVAGLALESARKLLGLLPTLDHLQHMPSHTFVRLGMWEEAVQSNILALRASVAASWKCVSPLYPAHNVEMGIFAAVQRGNYAESQVYARVLRELPRFVPETHAGVGTHWMAPLLVYVTYGKWTAIASEKFPPGAPDLMQSLSSGVMAALQTSGAGAGGAGSKKGVLWPSPGDVFEDLALDAGVRDAVPTSRRPDMMLYQDYFTAPDDGPDFALAVWLYAQVMVMSNQVYEISKLGDLLHASPPPPNLSGPGASPITSPGQQTSSVDDAAAALAQEAAAYAVSGDSGTALQHELEKDMILLKNLYGNLSKVVNDMPDDANTKGLAAAVDDGTGPDVSALVTGYKQIATIMHKMAEARVELVTGNYEKAVAALRKAVEVEDSGGYMEPPRLAHQPARQCLGWVLMREGKLAEAVQIYLEDLQRYPNNYWSMTGLKMIQDEIEIGSSSHAIDGREKLQKQVSEALKNSDIKTPILSSCPAFGVREAHIG